MSTSGMCPLEKGANPLALCAYSNTSSKNQDVESIQLNAGFKEEARGLWKTVKWLVGLTKSSLFRLFNLISAIEVIRGESSSKARTSHRDPPKVIVFDFGGVMGTSNKKKLVKYVENELLVPHEQAKNLVNLVKNRKGLTKEFLEEYSKKGTKVIPPNWLEQFHKLELDVVEVYPDVLKIVKELRAHGYRTAMLSNGGKERAMWMRKSGYDKNFDPAVTSCDIGAKKPEDQAYEKFLRLARVKASQCLFVDDELKNVKKAVSLGFDGILFTSAEDLRTELIKRSILTR